MSKKDEGFTVIDTVIALLILSIALTSVYSLVTKSIQLEHKLITTMDTIIDTGEKYDEDLKEIIDG